MLHRVMENFALEVSETARLIRREANRRVALRGAARAQWRVLKLLARTDGTLRQVELADALDVEPITLCRMIDRLEEAGLVERRRDESDRRAWRIHLTGKATPIIGELDKVSVGFNADILEGVDEADRNAANRVLAAIRKNLERIEQGIEQAS
jgi:DNA-binding MarR family transcriptional regulator